MKLQSGDPIIIAYRSIQHDPIKHEHSLEISKYTIDPILYFQDVVSSSLATLLGRSRISILTWIGHLYFEHFDEFVEEDCDKRAEDWSNP
jgi:hypothetical protein